VHAVLRDGVGVCVQRIRILAVGAVGQLRHAALLLHRALEVVAGAQRVHHADLGVLVRVALAHRRRRAAELLAHRHIEIGVGASALPARVGGRGRTHRAVEPLELNAIAEIERRAEPQIERDDAVLTEHRQPAHAAACVQRRDAAQVEIDPQRATERALADTRRERHGEEQKPQPVLVRVAEVRFRLRTRRARAVTQDGQRDQERGDA
jgi:hypothetical protein